MKNCVCACVTAVIVLAAGVSHAQTVQAGVKVGIDFSSLPNAGQVIDLSRLNAPPVAVVLRPNLGWLRASRAVALLEHLHGVIELFVEDLELVRRRRRLVLVGGFVFGLVAAEGRQGQPQDEQAPRDTVHVLPPLINV